MLNDLTSHGTVKYRPLPFIGQRFLAARTATEACLLLIFQTDGRRSDTKASTVQ